MNRITSLAITTVVASAIAFGATLTATVVDSNGKAVAGAVVTAVRQAVYAPSTYTNTPKLAPGEGEFGSSWTTDTTGKIQTSSIPAGNYLLCVQTANLSVIDPCIWSAPISVVGLQPQEQRDLGNVVLQRGVLVRIMISDPSSLLPQWSDISSDGGIIAGVFHDNQNWTPAVRNVDKTFSIAVPVGKVYQLWLFSRNVTFVFTGAAAIQTGMGLLSSSVTAGTEPAGGYAVTIMGRAGGN